MSTNFYWITPDITLPTGEVIEPDDIDPRIHIGKRSNGFLWAQDPDAVERAAASRPDEKLIRNEYGQHFTWREFQDELTGLKQDTGSVGTQFC